MKLIVRQYHLILHPSKTLGNEFKKEKDRKLSIFDFGNKVKMEILTIEINYKDLSIV